MKHVLAATAIAAIAAAAAVTYGRPATVADNHCPIGCVETDESTVVTPTTIVVRTREPWISGKKPQRATEPTPNIGGGTRGTRAPTATTTTEEMSWQTYR